MISALSACLCETRPRSLHLFLRTFDTMAAPSDCVTEVVLANPVSVVNLHQRLHQHLPSSPYRHGAIYSSIVEARKASHLKGCQRTSTAERNDHTPSTILLLRGAFKWRFGGEAEHNLSPPWSWTFEELCGKPFPYLARDLNCLTSVIRSTSTPCRSYTTIASVQSRCCGLRDTHCLLTFIQSTHRT